MNIEKQSQQTQILVRVFLGLMLVYLVFHLFLSERSIPAYFQTKYEYQALLKNNTRLVEERAKLQDHVTRLRPETLDMDLVEDYSLRMLGRGVSGSVILIQ